MTNTEAKVNYTEAQTASMIETYKANPTRETVKALAEALGKSERSIIAKLSREKVYVKAEYVAKNGEKPRAHTALWSLMKDLDTLGIVSAKKSGPGISGKTTVITLLDIPAKVLIQKMCAMLDAGK